MPSLACQRGGCDAMATHIVMADYDTQPPHWQAEPEVRHPRYCQACAEQRAATWDMPVPALQPNSDAARNVQRRARRAALGRTRQGGER